MPTGKTTTMSSVNEKVAKLTGTQATKPIRLSELDSKVDNAIANAKEYYIYKFIITDGTSVKQKMTRPIPEELKKFIGSKYKVSGEGYHLITYNGNVFHVNTQYEQWYNGFALTDSTITFKGYLYDSAKDVKARGDITFEVLFYK